MNHLSTIDNIINAELVRVIFYIKGELWLKKIFGVVKRP